MNTNVSGTSPAANTMFQMMLAKLNGDMRFVGIFSIIYGAPVLTGLYILFMIFFFGTLSNFSRSY